MPFQLNIPKFTTKDVPIMVGSMLPLSVLFNHIIFKERYFGEIKVFIGASLATFAFCAVVYMFYGLIAITLRNRYPQEHDAIKRMTICISIFVLLSSVVMTVLLRGYDFLDFFDYEYSESDFIKGYISLVIMDIFLTFLNEGISRFEKYSQTYKETEALKKEYMQSQLLGLKSQMNPHFLFNSLNTLSSLINEDAEQAEDFLDHMSKVYRYLLRNNEEQLVSIDTELSFIQSYSYLLKSRYADALELTVNVSDRMRQEQIPPLTLQMIMENILNQNTISKDTPLKIEIISAGNHILVKNSRLSRLNTAEKLDEGLDNIANKFRLLCQQEIEIIETPSEREIRLPVIPKNEMMIA